MSRSCPRSERTAPAPHPDPLLRLLSPGPHSSLARQGRTRGTAKRAAGPGHDHPNSRSRWPASSLRPPGGVVSAPHSSIFTATNAYTPAFFLLAAGHPPLGKSRPTRSSRRPEDADNLASLRVLSFLRPVRTARTLAKRGGRGF